MSKLLQLGFIAIGVITLWTGCNLQGHTDIRLHTAAERLQLRMDTLRQHGFMFGHQNDTFYGTTWEFEADKSDTRLVTGDYPALMGFELGGIESGDEKNCDSVPFEQIRREAIKHYLRGGILSFSWHPRNPATGGSSEDVSDTATVSSLLAGGARAELFQSWTNRVIEFLQSIKASDGRHPPFILNPWQDCNSSRFWWGQDNCTPQQYKALWNLFQDRVNAAMPNNVIWAFSADLYGTWDPSLLERYPGDSRVFLLGIDACQTDREKEFVKRLDERLATAHGFAQKHKKLMALTECGYRNSPDGTWWTRVLKPVVEKYPVSYILSGTNRREEHYGPAPDLQTQEDFVRFYEAPNTLFLGDVSPKKANELGRDSSEIIWL